MIYFTAWCGAQIGDFKFQNNFPDWGSMGFWEKEINDLEMQLSIIIDCLKEDQYTGIIYMEYFID